MALALQFQFEKKVALAAVTRACALTQQVFHNLVAAQSQTLTKDDKSPVTVADFSAQAVINTVLRSAFPNDPIIGEEDSADLRSTTSTAALSLRSRLESLANDALRAPLTKDEDPAWGIGPAAPIRSIDTLLTAIDQGNHKGGPTGRQWTLDPIDGTKGFLRGEQYAVCLALIVDSVVQVSVTGCPNLPVSSSNPDGERGCLFVAVKGQGAEQRLLSDPWGSHTPLKLQPTLLSKLALLESREGAHSSHDLSAKISQRIGLTAPPIRMDSQAKYCALARGDGGIFLRLPIPGKGYVEKIWDHAAGALLVTEAGAAISDTRGEPLNFGLGRTLGENHGIIAAFKDIHPQIIQSIAALRAEEQQQQQQQQNSSL